MAGTPSTIGEMQELIPFLIEQTDSLLDDQGDPVVPQIKNSLQKLEELLGSNLNDHQIEGARFALDALATSIEMARQESEQAA